MNCDHDSASEVLGMPEPTSAKLATILVVDDDDAVRSVVVAILEQANFHVLCASSGRLAITLAQATIAPIHLLLSDIDMPVMSGPALGEALKIARPEMRVMLMSGGQSGNLLVLNYGWAFINKPFVVTKLIEMVTEVLQKADESQPGGHGFDTRRVSGDES